MKQFEKTNLFSLEIGDRFYFVLDKKKKVREVLKKSDSGYEWSKEMLIGGNSKPEKITTDKQVIFLRKTNN